MKERIRIINTEGKARRGEIHTPHGVVQTPAFMNVATCGAIKGAVSALDLKDLKCQVQLCNTYHLHLSQEMRLSNYWRDCTSLQTGKVQF